MIAFCPLGTDLGGSDGSNEDVLIKVSLETVTVATVQFIQSAT